MKRSTKISYIVQSSIGFGAYVLLVAFVSIKLTSVEQLGLATKLAVWGLLWGVAIYIFYGIVDYYKKLDDYDLNSNDKGLWSTGSEQLSPTQSNIKNIFWGLILLAGTIVLCWMMAFYVTEIFKASAAKNWPTTAGVVVSSKVVQGCSKSYNPEILYKYKVGLTFYMGKRLAFGNVECGTISESQAIAKQYPVGAAILVYFNPKSPSDAVVLVGRVSSGTWLAIFMLPFMIVGVAFASWLFLRNIRFTFD
ncbi:MAG: DUF3592 domain-containing protein [Burkholderiales bacterium]|nr:DUF3592 domain-containing protein [Burkholderiales bacterium]